MNIPGVRHAFLALAATVLVAAPVVASTHAHLTTDPRPDPMPQATPHDQIDPTPSRTPSLRIDRTDSGAQWIRLNQDTVPGLLRVARSDAGPPRPPRAFRSAPAVERGQASTTQRAPKVLCRPAKLIMGQWSKCSRTTATGSW